MISPPPKPDSILAHIVKRLRTKYDCHTIILYGSRARGDATQTSDYDVMGVCKSGDAHRLVTTYRKAYLDIFVFPEKSLKKLTEDHLYMRNAVILYQEGTYGTRFIKRLNTVWKAPHLPRSLEARHLERVWSTKMLERSKVNDIEGHYRRTWLLMSLLEMYFTLRKKRYLGSKGSFQWLATHDPQALELFDKALAIPTDLNALESLQRYVINTSK